MALTVDRETRTISDVAVMTLGVTIDGRFTIDETTLQQVHDLMSARVDGMPVLSEHYGETSDLVGRLLNPRIVEGALRADLELFAAAEDVELLLEAAEKMPSGFGLSISAYDCTTDGKEKLLRVNSMSSVDLAQLPAANPRGLLSGKGGVDTGHRIARAALSGATLATIPSPPPDMTPEEINSAVAAAVTAAMEPINAELADLKAKLEALPAPAPKEDEAVMAATLKAQRDQTAAQVIDSLNAQLGARLGIKLKANPHADDNAAPGTPEAVIETTLKAHVAAGKSAREAYTLTAQSHPKEYQAALSANRLPKL
jgi:hypothetical protein